MELQGKVAIVTGGGSGIGRATAVRLAREGATVIVADRNLVGAEETMASIKATGGAATAVDVDVTDEAALRSVISRTEQEFGGLDIMVNNAGVTSGQPAFPETPTAQWGRTLAINLQAVILGTQLAIPALTRRGGGAIVNTASLAGILGFAVEPVYAAAKGGVVLLTRSLAGLRGSHNIRVNCVCPGLVDTPLLSGFNATIAPEQQALVAAAPKLAADDVAGAIVSLITDDSAAGQALAVAAGMPRRPISAPSPADLMAPAAAAR
jgi:NAD(P)-dependent dehydrogenase (short-subunit alcohol dehydrogenase family)